MPELPEVETVVRDLKPRLAGRQITSIRVGQQPLRRRWQSAWNARLIGRRITGLGRRGKWIVMTLDDNQSLVWHLGMTGQLVLADSRVPPLPHTHVLVDFDVPGEQLRFRDVRRFGSVSLFTQQECEQFFVASGLGPEPFTLSAELLYRKLQATRRCLKAVLLDQRVVAGLGNIYADEALFEAKLHPQLSGQKITLAEAHSLKRAIVTVLRRAIEKRGSSIRDYLGGMGERGNYQREFRVYGQAGKPCSRCRFAIARIRLAGRSTYFCPSCQKKGRRRASGRSLERRQQVPERTGPS
ncbi:MAG: formamidopyrimidine-DNA glycosylase [Gemmatales bacterium]|nr:MAG: formamidopyrimidine-DNA glycosylase [Gemmatales bacterium]